MGLTPMVLWGRRLTCDSLDESDKHLQNYTCSVARRLTQTLLSSGEEAFDGFFSYNACDTLRNLPEIIQKNMPGKYRDRPWFHLHVPMTHVWDRDIERYLKSGVWNLVHTMEQHVGVGFSPERFLQTVHWYQKKNRLAGQLEKSVASGALSFSAFLQAMDDSVLMPVEDQAALFERAARIASQEQFLSPGCARIVLSGILPPPPDIARTIDDAGLRVVGNDIASLARSYLSNGLAADDPAEYYTRFYRDHHPCPTLLYTGDRRLERIRTLITDTKADGVIFIAEKFCEYEYLEFPFLEKLLKSLGISVLFLEISADDDDSRAIQTRIEAFAEVLSAAEERT